MTITLRAPALDVTSMPEAALKAAKDRLTAIEGAKKALADQQRELDALNRHAAQKDQEWADRARWNVTLALEKRNGFNDLTVTIPIPFGVVQQTLIDRVRAARREVVKLGGFV